MCSTTKVIGNKPPLMTLPNELFLEVASHLKSFRDLNSLVRTSRRFHTMFNTHLYHRAVAGDNIVLDDIVSWVLSRYRLASLTLLLDNGLSVNHTRPFIRGEHLEETMLCSLCRLPDQERSVPLARLLIQRGADVNAKDPMTSGTVLHVAAIYDNCGIATLLLGHPDSVDINAADYNGQTPLHYASKEGYEMVEWLISHGAAVEARAFDGDTPLLSAVGTTNYGAIPLLLAHGADVRVHNIYGYTPLHLAARWFPPECRKIAKSLLERGADVNATAVLGQTPLHLAQGLFMVKLLLKNGAHVNVLCSDGRSPLQYALERRLRPVPRIVALLLKHGADESVLNEDERRQLRHVKSDHVFEWMSE
jgi:ankyrin repeat protein